eukprot:TRINITY_DN1544_c0_g1_i1.p1 TRINITY_DN1544_c0_g1~~TRINITY_DN1544_c0_g1_i1.p1  ORF type:complete len:207 (-),score=53.22 TRINITY_DN1544_c0_g1_i1:72-671(-)
MSAALQNQLFNLKLTSKQLQRMQKKCEKTEKANKTKVAAAIAKGNMDGAKIYAENAIREKNQGLNYLRLASRLDAVAARLETAIRMRQVTGSMTTIVNSLEKASKSMNLEQLTMTMDKFEKSFEDLDVQSNYASDTMNRVTSSSVPADEVDLLIGEVSAARGLEVSEQLSGKVPNAMPQAASKQGQEDLAARLAKLKGT